MSDTQQLQTKAQKYSQSFNDAQYLHNEMVAEINAIKDVYKPRLKRALKRATKDRADLIIFLEQHPELFTKPRTQVICDIKVGYAKQRGTIQIADEQKTISLIHQKMQNADVLLSTKVSVNKSAVGRLPVSDCKKLGIVVTDDTDKVVCKSMNTSVEKIITELANELLED